jgi:hypothetical protein
LIYHHYAKDQIIDFGYLERGLRKRLLKKGDKKKNVEEYFGKILNSLKYRVVVDMVLNQNQKIMSLKWKNLLSFQKNIQKRIIRFTS